MPRVRFSHYLLGLYGVAVIRNWMGGDEHVGKLVRATREFGSSIEQSPSNVEFELRNDQVMRGYAAWSTTYDQAANPLVALEQPIVRSLIDQLPVGRAIDAACGTGRHTEYLCARGFETTGVDLTPEMLALARNKAPAARFFAGDIMSLDFPNQTFDLAVCALALEHCADLRASVGELARVVRQGGAIIVSTLHPMSARLGGGAFYRDASGGVGKVHTAGHEISDYINTFVHHGLDINACVEAPWGVSEIAMMRALTAFLPLEILNAALGGIPCALVWRLTRR